MLLTEMGCETANVHLGTYRQTKKVLKDMKMRERADCGTRQYAWQKSWKETGSAIERFDDPLVISPTGWSCVALLAREQCSNMSASMTLCDLLL